MNFSIEEAKPTETLVWDTNAKFVHNLEKIDFLSFNLALRDTIVADSEKDIIVLAKAFSKSLSELVFAYDAQLNELYKKKRGSKK